MAIKFQKGDLVQLKSGGPSMTVRFTPDDDADYPHEDGQYLCEWFKGASRDKGNFEEHVLQSFVAPMKAATKS
jgi:uncharacterized protein YodC (DUF2158 family)